ncbi:hypothetical protein J6590_012233 [Homalodisca vitripennis]|nr:hypothetical protein J6590_012233 [Homalodisca vitripennis]
MEVHSSASRTDAAVLPDAAERRAVARRLNICISSSLKVITTLIYSVSTTPDPLGCLFTAHFWGCHANLHRESERETIPQPPTPDFTAADSVRPLTQIAPPPSYQRPACDHYMHHAVMMCSSILMNTISGSSFMLNWPVSN